jgi:hypothetical protein
MRAGLTQSSFATAEVNEKVCRPTFAAMEMKWRSSVVRVIGCQRKPNGSTPAELARGPSTALLTTRNSFVDTAGNEYSDASTHPVGQLLPNAWGLFDLHGNVWEWCLDGLHDYPPNAVVNPRAAQRTDGVIRGGSWRGDARHCRAACRGTIETFSQYDDLGFRLATVPPGESNTTS